MLLFSLFLFSKLSLFACVSVCGEAVGMRSECKVLVRIKKGCGWQLEEHPEIAGAVGLLGSSGGDEGGSRVGAAAAAGGGRLGPACAAGGWCISLLRVSCLGRTRGSLLSGVLSESPCHTELQK